MNQDDKMIDQLTRDLMRSGMESPSPDLSLRIMQKIAQEVPVTRKTYLIPPVSFPNFMSLFKWGVAGYVIVCALIIVIFINSPVSGMISGFWVDHKEVVLYFLTLIGIVSSILFYSALDRMLFPDKK
ncbi:MAG: hypothetical protein LUG51_02595 [Tannerellaceae bacterium]|nr:hypothetical protein [Tannerellaceae bacterium]